MSFVQTPEPADTTTDPVVAGQHRSRARLAVGYLAIAAILPYLVLKLAWIFGSDVGMVSASPVDTAMMHGGNTATAAMEVIAAAIILAFTHAWGRHAPAWLVLVPAWIATGLLAPFIITGPAVLASVATGASSVGDGSLAPWVGPLVYTSFAAQGVGIAASFTLYARDRWPHVLKARVTDRLIGPSQPAVTLVSWLAAAFLAAVLIARLSWALGSTWGLTAHLVESRGITEQLADAATALFAIAAAAGCLAIAYRRPRHGASWIPISLAWVGSGAIWGSGTYALVLVLAGVAGAGTPATQAGFVPFVDFTQVIVGTMIAVAGTFILADWARHQRRSVVEPSNDA